MVKQGTLYTTLAIATLAVSWAAILFKLSGAEPLPAAFYRMAITALILAIPAIPKLRKAISGLSGKESILLVLSGLVLGLHFATWVTSLFYTTISNSALIVSTQPVWLLILEIVFFKIRITSKIIVGMVIALIGMFIISQSDFNLSRDHITGDLLALAGAVFAALYLLIGRRLRSNMDNLSYIFPVYTIAAITLLIISLCYNENLTDYPIKTWGVFLLLALIPTILGHSLYNWLLKYFQAHKIGITILGEPIGATILAIFIFDQIPKPVAIAGGFLILIGIFTVLYKRKIDTLEIKE